MSIFGLFFVTAAAALVGCYLPLLGLAGKGAAWTLLPAGFSVALCIWLLSLHPSASGRPDAFFAMFVHQDHWPYFFLNSFT